MMLLGNIIMGLGVALFKLSTMGNDPFNGMNMSVANAFELSYPLVQVCVNILLFIVELLWGRKYIGIGTIVNAVFCGYIVSFFYWILTGMFGIEFSLWMSVVIVLIAIVVICFGLSLYQQSDAGVAPYDSLALIFTDKWKKVPYFWCRMLCDGFCAIIIFLTGGILGLGTLVTAFGLGPVVHIFDKTITKKILK